MNPYYQSLLSEIVRLYSNGEYDRVNALVQEELSMPYIPAEAQEILEHYQAESRSYLSKTPASSRDQIENLVRGTMAQKEMAASALQAMNLRQYQSEVQTLLNADDLLDEFKGELIEALIEQKLDDEFTIRKDGLEIEFIPSLILDKNSDPVLARAREYFDDWMTSDNPGLAAFCQQLLDQEVLEKRPFDFQDEDPKALAASVVRLVFEAMGDPDGWNQFVCDHCLEKVKAGPLLIEKRGENSL